MEALKRAIEVFGFFFFFFQAEDGIRDRNVTGVQTCALPISVSSAGPCSLTSLMTHRVSSADAKKLTRKENICSYQYSEPAQPPYCRSAARKIAKIGRASCRERGERWEDRGSLITIKSQGRTY